MKALKAKKSAQAIKDGAKEKEEKEKIIERGGNPNEEMIKMKRLSDFENAKK